MSKKNKLIPELRFPEFANEREWEIKEVGEIFEVTRGYVLAMSLVKENQSEENPYPVFSSQTKNNGLAGFYKDYLYESAITWTTDGANAGDVNYRNGKFYCTNVCGVLINKKGYANKCVSELINSVAKKYVSYVGNPKLMNGVMSQIKIPTPSPEEQQKIASCLSSLDEVITAHNQKLEQLKEHKKGMMQNLFPQEGEKVPKLRFKEFEKDGEWIKKTVGEFAPLQRGFDLPIDSIVAGDYPVVFSNGVSKYHNEYKVKAPGVVTGRSGTIGKVTYINENFWPHNTSLWVTDFLGNYPLFVFYYFYVIGLEQFGTGSGVPTLNRNDVHRHSILVPKPKEQQKIAFCLSTLDELIKAQAEKIEQLKQQKKGLMQGLFPKMND